MHRTPSVRLVALCATAALCCWPATAWADDPATGPGTTSTSSAAANPPGPHFDQPRTVVQGTALLATGRLLDALGQPLAGMRISLLLDGAELAVVTTGPDGAFSAKAEVPVGTADKDHDAQVVWAGANGLAGTSSTSTVRVSRMIATTASIKASPGAKAGARLSFSGTMLDASRKPAAGLQVMVRDSRNTWSDPMVTDASGNFSGTILVEVGSAPEHRTLTVLFEGDPGHKPSSATTTFDVLPGGFTPPPRPSQGPTTPREPGASNPIASQDGSGLATVPPRTPSPSEPMVARIRPASSHGLALAALATLGLVVSLAAMGRSYADHEAEDGVLIGDRADEGADGPGH